MRRTHAVQDFFHNNPEKNKFKNARDANEKVYTRIRTRDVNSRLALA
jgi:hypothetical protein